MSRLHSLQQERRRYVTNYQNKRRDLYKLWPSPYRNNSKCLITTTRTAEKESQSDTRQKTEIGKAARTIPQNTQRGMAGSGGNWIWRSWTMLLIIQSCNNQSSRRSMQNKRNPQVSTAQEPMWTAKQIKSGALALQEKTLGKQPYLGTRPKRKKWSKKRVQPPA